MGEIKGTGFSSQAGLLKDISLDIDLSSTFTMSSPLIWLFSDGNTFAVFWLSVTRLLFRSGRGCKLNSWTDFNWFSISSSGFMRLRLLSCNFCLASWNDRSFFFAHSVTVRFFRWGVCVTEAENARPTLRKKLFLRSPSSLVFSGTRSSWLR